MMHPKEGDQAMVTASDLLRMPISYDIVVSDFGRDATVEFLRLESEIEKKLLTSILAREGLRFFDEYRRIMFTIIGDLAYFKRSTIADEAASQGCLSERILIGVASTAMSQDFVDRVTLSVVQEMLAAHDRGYERFRIMIPCNTLSPLANHIGHLLSSEAELHTFVQLHLDTIANGERLTDCSISTYTVPAAVIHHLEATMYTTSGDTGRATPLLVMGTRDTNVFYATLTEPHSFAIVPLTSSHYELIDKAVVASIGGDPRQVDRCRDELKRDLIDPLQSQHTDLVVLEACTDFHLGLGINSLALFAEAMVAECYQI